MVCVLYNEIQIVSYTTVRLSPAQLYDLLFIFTEINIVCTAFICVSQSPLQTQDWRIIYTAFICVSQSLLQTRQEDHMY